MGVLEAAAGLTGVALTAVLELAKRIRAKQDRAFENPRPYEELQKLKGSPEWALVKEMIHDNELRSACFFGLKIRASQGNDLAVQKLRDEFRHEKGPDRLAIAQAMEVGQVYELASTLRTSKLSLTQQTRYLEEFLNRIAAHSVFVTKEDRPYMIECTHKLWAGPLVFCVAGSGRAARKAAEIGAELQLGPFPYTFEERRGPNRYVLFMFLDAPDLSDHSSPPGHSKKKPSKRRA